MVKRLHQSLSHASISSAGDLGAIVVQHIPFQQDLPRGLDRYELSVVAFLLICSGLI